MAKPGLITGAPSLSDIQAARSRLSAHTKETPTVPAALTLYGYSDIGLKLECMQHTGTFKARGALNNMLTLSDRAPRVTAVSAGNHAVAVAYAARTVGADAKVVMQASANPLRVQRAQSFGAEVLIAEDGNAAFELATAIAENENRTFIHPFEGVRVTEATAGIALELLETYADPDCVVVPVGGGGLASGIAVGVRLSSPKCKVFGVEPEGADTMVRSLASGKPETLGAVSTIADSLGPPMTTPYAFSVCQAHLDDVVTVSDDQIAAATYLMFQELKIAVEPAGATALAGLLGPLRQRTKERRVALVISGSNIDPESYSHILRRGAEALDGGAFD